MDDELKLIEINEDDINKFKEKYDLKNKRFSNDKAYELWNKIVYRTDEDKNKDELDDMIFSAIDTCNSFSTDKIMKQLNEKIGKIKRALNSNAFKTEDFNLGSSSLSHENELSEQEWSLILDYIINHNYLIKGKATLANDIFGYEGANNKDNTCDEDELDDIIGAAISKSSAFLESFIEDKTGISNIKIDKSSIKYDDTCYVNDTVDSFFIDFNFELHSYDLDNMDRNNGMLFDYNNLDNLIEVRYLKQ